MARMAPARLDFAMLYASLPQSGRVGRSPKEINKKKKQRRVLEKSFKGPSDMIKE